MSAGAFPGPDRDADQAGSEVRRQPTTLHKRIQNDKLFTVQGVSVSAVRRPSFSHASRHPHASLVWLHTLSCALTFHVAQARRKRCVPEGKALCEASQAWLRYCAIAVLAQYTGSPTLQAPGEAGDDTQPRTWPARRGRMNPGRTHFSIAHGGLSIRVQSASTLACEGDPSSVGGFCDVSASPNCCDGHD